MPPRVLPPCTAARALYRGPVLRNHHPSFLRTASSKATPPTTKKKKPAAAKPLPYQAPQARPPHAKPVDSQGQQQQEQGQGQKTGGSKKAPVSELLRDRWIAVVGFGGAIVCLGYFTASLSMYWRQEPARCYPVGLEPETPTGRPAIQSPYEFDLHLDKSEWRFGITRLRRELGAEARGHVLEVAIGTGRNLEFYDWRAITGKAAAAAASKTSLKDNKGEGAVLSFTGVDISPGMLDIALKRMRQVVPHMTGEIPKKPSFAILATAHKSSPNTTPPKQEEGNIVSFLDDKIRLLQSDVSTALPAPLSPSRKYDTILQTFGLCSVQDPVALLSLMAASVQPNTGRILLLEHGRSVWEVVNGLLDRGARGHHERFGCWWNRDIEVIVTAAAHRVPGLEIVRLERPGWTTAGTHVVVELRVRDVNDDRAEREKEKIVTGWASLIPALLAVKTPDDNDAKKSG